MVSFALKKVTRMR